ncbi:MAG TPA: EscU/YscU/HrcU family type III secretion system export apparatus switch protein [Patescibacteria group bacterium]|nr:EscU/YscU/HrcU family type III secretion system export apparatus switch protein [Patescibacteria group bacterium]
MKNKMKKAAALSYQEGQEAPIVAALGKGEVAERIIKTAKENDVPIFENEELISTLIHLDLGQQIPQELFSVVAEVLIFVSDIEKKLKE